MIVGIDGNEANIKNRVGVNTYAYELLKNLWKLQDEWKDKHKLMVYLKDDPREDMPKETEFFKYKVIKGGGAWILTKLMPNLLFTKPKCDIFFSPSHYVPLIVSIPRICSIMDLGYLEYTEQFRKKDIWQLKIWSAISIYVSKAIFAISNSTKADIVRHYPSAKNKIYVTPLAYDPIKFNLKISDEDVRRVRDKYSIVSDYVLYLGTLKPSKNIEGLVAAFSRLKNVDEGLKLVLAGKKGWLYEPIFKKVKDLGLEDDVIFTDFVDEEDKPALIKGAKVFVLPSFWEGFGLDVLAAMACGVPVVVSKVGSLPEVAGDAGILVDPKSVESIAGGIKEVLLAPITKYNSMVGKGLAQAKKFSWEKTARETLKIITNI
ncbi:MAG TPA: glycosyltransferase family 1 protein [Candidatus Saccharimonadales bacterium]|jgi:glycosyltransferase involved in cell wall biosynthesis|nr:glycosyltransferase family 1 protein [Candidatus Saccharimonadales bacterium]